MARARRAGVEYFPFDTGLLMNRKVRLLRSSYGNDGVFVFINILSKIYGGTGYYFLLTDEEIELLADDVSLEKDRIDEIIKCAIRVNLFSSEMYNRYSILTSCKIQEQYIEICKKRKSIPMVKDFSIYRAYNILDATIPKIMPEPNPFIELLKVPTSVLGGTLSSSEYTTDVPRGTLSTLDPPSDVPKGYSGTQRETEIETETERETEKTFSLSESDYPVLIKRYEEFMLTPQYKGAEKDAERLAYKFCNHVKVKYGDASRYRDLDAFIADAINFALNER